MGGRRLIILDTHIWIWFNLAPERLPKPVAKAFKQPGAEFGISAILVWETVLAAQRARIETALSPEANARAWLATSPIMVLPIDADVTILARTLGFEHSDPARRFIAATAYRLGCPLATVDERLQSLPWLKVLS